MVDEKKRTSKRSQKNRQLERACRLVVESYYPRGKWLYDAFDDINRKYFKGKLPCPLIAVELTPHSGCLGWHQAALDQPPRIAIHPSVFGGSKQSDPWGVNPLWFGEAYAYDVLMHECIHLAVHSLLGGYKGPSSHNNDAWIAEVNRLAPLLGFKDILVGRQVCKRVPIDGELTKTGKPATEVCKVDLGNVPFVVAAGFPGALRVHIGQADAHYRGSACL